MKSLFTKLYLFIAGLTMMIVGIYIAIMTTEYISAMTARNTTLSVSMLSELRGMGGMLLVMGSYVFLSTFRKGWWNPAMMTATAVYASFTAFRSLGFVLDGLPEITIILAYVIETVLALLGVFLIKIKVSATASGKPLIS